MKHGAEGKEPIQNMLMQCEGVSAVEPTYQTDRRGQWNIVVDKSMVTDLSEYVQNNLSQIYSNRTGKKSKLLITNMQEKQNPSYKLILVDTVESKVGSYAEVLKRRFPQQQVVNTPPSNQHRPETENKQVSKMAANIATQNAITGTKLPILAQKTTEDGNISGNVTKEARVTSIIQTLETKFSERMDRSIKKQLDKYNQQLQTQFMEVEQRLCDKLSTLDTDRLEKSIQTKVEEQNMNMQSKITEVEQRLQSQVDNLAQVTDTFQSEIDRKVGQQIDTVMDSKLRAVSLLVADTVTANVVKALYVVLPTDMVRNADKILVSQSTPEVYKTPTSSILPIIAKGTDEQDPKVDGTNLMLSALEEIEQTQKQTTDSPHDNLQESSETKT